MHHLPSTVLILTLLHLVPRGSGDTFKGKDCRVDAFPTQPEFNAEAYQGQWYGIAISRYWIEIPFVSEWFPPTDIQVVYTLNKDGNIDIKTIGSGFLGFGCSETDGLAEAPNKEFPQKNAVSFPGTLLGLFIGTKPYWILRTDYTGFAVVYSCWKKASDGTCEPGQAFLWTINRNPEGHTPEQWDIINAVAEGVCFDPSKLKMIKQTGKCNVKDEKAPKDEI